MSPLVSFVGAKGGTLKSASAAAVAHVVAATGIRVMLLDGDPQADLTRRSNFARVARPLEAEPVRVTMEREPTMDLQLLRGGRSLEGESLPLVRQHIRRALNGSAQLVIADTPPAIGVITTAAIEASSMIIIPSQPGIESLERIGDVLETVQRVNQDCPVRILITMANLQSNVYHLMVEQVDRTYPGMRMDPVIPFEMAANESGFFRLPVTVTAPKSRAAMAYCDVAVEVLRRTGVEAEVHGVREAAPKTVAEVV